MAARLNDRRKKKIIADYLDNGSYRATGKMNGVSDMTVKKVVLECGDFRQKLEEKKEQNTADILAYMEGKRKEICEIISVALEVLPQKLRDAKSASEVTTALGTVIDKWAMVNGSPGDTQVEDALSQSLKELGERLESDE